MDAAERPGWQAGRAWVGKRRATVLGLRACRPSACHPAGVGEAQQASGATRRTQRPRCGAPRLQAPLVAPLQLLLDLLLLLRVLLNRLHRLPGCIQDLLQLLQRILHIVPAPPTHQCRASWINCSSNAGVGEVPSWETGCFPARQGRLLLCHSVPSSVTTPRPSPAGRQQGRSTCWA